MIDFTSSTERPTAAAAKKHVANSPRRRKAPTPGAPIPILANMTDAEAYLRARWPGDFTSSPTERRVAAALVLGFQATLHMLPTQRRKQFVGSLVPVVIGWVEKSGKGTTRALFMAEAGRRIADIGGTEYEGVDPTPA